MNEVKKNDFESLKIELYITNLNKYIHTTQNTDCEEDILDLENIALKINMPMRDVIKIIQKETLCWSCKRAVDRDYTECSWCDKGEPVLNWEAKPTVIKVSLEEKVESYFVKTCPLYIPNRVQCRISDLYKIVAAKVGVSTKTLERKPAREIKKYIQMLKENPEYTVEVFYAEEDTDID